MDIWQLLRVLARRWFVVLPLLVLTIAMAASVRRSVAPAYGVASTVILLPPDQALARVDGGTVTVPVNPYLNFTGSTQTATLALSLAATSPGFRRSLAGSAPLAAYSVTVVQRSPVLQVAVESKDRRFAAEATAAVIRGLERELAVRQAGAVASQRITLSILSPPAVASVNNAPLRAAAVTGIAGALGSIMLTLAVDALLLMRARHPRRRASRSSSEMGLLSESKRQEMTRAAATRSPEQTAQ